MMDMIEMERTDYLSCSRKFRSWTFDYLVKHVDAHEKKEHLLSVVMASLFCEALLKDICDFYSLIPSKQELHSLVSSINSLFRESRKKAETDAPKLPDDEVTRLKHIVTNVELIRPTRNKVVHDSGIDGGDLAEDEDHIHNKIRNIVKEYLDSAACASISRKRDEKELSETKPEPSCKLNVFVSCITTHTTEQEVFLNSVCRMMEDRGINPIRYSNIAFSETAPIEQIRAAIEECDAFLTIGLERSHSYYFCDKEYSNDAASGTHRKYTSGWLNLESGIAIAQKKPIFIMKQKGLFGDGIFDDKNQMTILNTPLNPFQSGVKKVLDELEKLAAKTTV